MILLVMVVVLLGVVVMLLLLVWLVCVFVVDSLHEPLVCSSAIEQAVLHLTGIVHSERVARVLGDG